MKFGFIGCGNMASAIINGGLKKGIFTKEELLASVKTEASARKVQDTLGISCTTDNLAVAAQADYLFLAVKPQFCEEVASQISQSRKEGQILVSIAAGKTLAWLKEKFGKDQKIIRTMPNTPALVGEGITGVCPDNLVTEEEIISMVDDAHEKGVIEENEAEMIQNIIEFSETEAQDIMTHRKNINGLDENTTLKDALEFMLNNSNSRYPVYREDLDNIVGILHLKDAMRQISSSQCGDLAINVIPGLIREASYIPETRNINELFKAMQAKKIHMAIVVDEYGQTAGLVTMEDILEEIVGNILDEYDEEEQFIHVQTDDSLIMDGFTPLEQVDEVLDSDFDETEEFDTLNGYLTSVLGHVPNIEEDKEIKAKGYLFTILGVENNTIQKVRVEKLPEEERGEETCQDIQNSQT